MQRGEGKNMSTCMPVCITIQRCLRSSYRSQFTVMRYVRGVQYPQNSSEAQQSMTKTTSLDERDAASGLVAVGRVVLLRLQLQRNAYQRWRVVLEIPQSSEGWCLSHSHLVLDLRARVLYLFVDVRSSGLGGVCVSCLRRLAWVSRQWESVVELLCTLCSRSHLCLGPFHAAICPLRSDWNDLHAEFFRMCCTTSAKVEGRRAGNSPLKCSAGQEARMNQATRRRGVA